MILTPEFRPWVVPFEVTGDNLGAVQPDRVDWWAHGRDHIGGCILCGADVGWIALIDDPAEPIPAVDVRLLLRRHLVHAGLGAGVAAVEFWHATVCGRQCADLLGL